MTTDDGDIKKDRDENLIHGFTDRSRGLLNDYERWLSDEIRELQGKIETIQLTTNDVLQLELQIYSEELEVIERHRFPEAKRNLRQKCSEMEDGGQDNIMDANQWIQDGINRFENLARSVLSIRKDIDRIWNEDT